LDLLEESREVVDNYGKPEILFFGPDEGTADFMDWASRAAKRRGFRYPSFFLFPFFLTSFFSLVSGRR
jgi:NAD-specific glutamate dehydrogenase